MKHFSNFITDFSILLSLFLSLSLPLKPLCLFLQSLFLSLQIQKERERYLFFYLSQLFDSNKRIEHESFEGRDNESTLLRFLKPKPDSKWRLKKKEIIKWLLRVFVMRAEEARKVVRRTTGPDPGKMQVAWGVLGGSMLSCWLWRNTGFAMGPRVQVCSLDRGHNFRAMRRCCIFQGQLRRMNIHRNTLWAIMCVAKSIHVGIRNAFSVSFNKSVS